MTQQEFPQEGSTPFCPVLIVGIQTRARPWVLRASLRMGSPRPHQDKGSHTPYGEWGFLEAAAGGPAHSGSLSPRTQKQRPCRGPGKETFSPQTPGSRLSEAALPLADRGARSGREEQKRLSRPGAAKAKGHPLAATRCVHHVRGPRPGEEPGRRYKK